jgi:small-conductance mechanosensitive channel
VAVPRDLAGIEAARKAVERARSEVLPATQPASTQPQDEERARAAADLLKTLTDYADALKQFEAELKANEMLISPAEQDGRARQLAGARERDQQVQTELEKAVSSASTMDVEEAEADYEYWSTEFNALTAQQTAREKRLTEFEAEQRRAQEGATAAQAELAQARQAAATQPAEAAGTMPDSINGLRLLEWRAALAQLREEVLKAEQVRVSQEQKLDGGYLPVLASLVEHLGQWAGKLRSIADTSQQDEIQRKLAQTSDPVERLFLEGAALVAGTVKEFNDTGKRTRERFPRYRSEEWTRQITRERAAWERRLEALERTTGKTRLRWYDEALQTIARVQRRLETEVRPILDATFADRDKLLARRDEYQSQQQKLAARFEEMQIVAVSKQDLLRAAEILKAEVTAFLDRTQKADAVRSALRVFDSAVEGTLPEGPVQTDLILRLAGLSRALGLPLPTPPDVTGATRAKEGIKSAVLGAAGSAEPENVRAALAELLAAVRALPDRSVVSRAKQDESELIRDYYPRAQEVIARALANADDVISRAQEALTERTHYLEDLSEWRDRLYWTSLLARDNGWFNADFEAMGAEFDALRPPGAEGLRALRAQFARQLDTVPPLRWLLMLLLMAACLVAGGLARRRLLMARSQREERALAHMADTQNSELALSTRLGVQTLGLLAAISVWALPIGVLVLAVRFLPGFSGTPQRLLIGALLYIAGWLLAFNVWTRLFEPGKARFRLIGCSNVVALHYRRWGQAILVLSGIMLGVSILGEALDILPNTRAYLLQIYKGIALILILLFARRRDLVLKVVGRSGLLRHRQVYGVIVSIYPVVWLALVALIVLQMAGYGALTHYVVVNGLQTVLVAALAFLLARLVREEFQRLAKHVEGWAQSAAGSSAETQPAPDEDVEVLLGGAAAREWSLFLNICGVLFRWAVGLGAMVWIAWAWGLTRRQFADGLRTPLWGNAQTGSVVTVGRMAAAIGAVILAVWLSRLLRRALQTRVYPFHSSIDRGAQATINTLLHYTLIILGIYFGLRAVHVDLGALLLLLGGLGLGLGLGLQPLIVNFFSGILMLFERHVRVGDSVMIDGQLGEVTHVSMRSTTVRTTEGVHLVVPNGEFITKIVTNWTRGMIRGQIGVKVGSSADPERVRDILLSIGRRSPKVLASPEPAVWLTDLADGDLSFALVCWFSNPGDRAQAMTDMRFEISEALHAQGVIATTPKALAPAAALPPERPFDGETAARRRAEVRK